MKISVFSISLLALAGAQNVDWFGACTDDIASQCPDQDRGATFKCLADKFRVKTLENEDCSGAVELRGKQERTKESDGWKEQCAADMAAHCPDVPADAKDVVLYNCLAKKQNALDQECLRFLILKQTAEGRSPGRPAPARKPPQPATMPPGISARIRSSSQPNKCVSFTKQGGTLENCEEKDPKQAWYIITTNSGYSLAILDAQCMTPAAALVPCATPGKTFFSLWRRDDYTMVIQDLSTEKCMKFGADGLALDGDCEAAVNGWFVEPLFRKFVVQQPATNPPTAATENSVFVVKKPVKKCGPKCKKAQQARKGKKGKTGKTGKTGKQGN